MTTGCADSGHHYGDASIYAFVVRPGREDLAVCKTCLSGWQDRLMREPALFTIRYR